MTLHTAQCTKYTQYTKCTKCTLMPSDDKERPMGPEDFKNEWEDQPRVKRCAEECSAVQCSAVIAVQCNVEQTIAVQCSNPMQCSADQ